MIGLGNDDKSNNKNNSFICYISVNLKECVILKPQTWMERRILKSDR